MKDSRNSYPLEGRASSWREDSSPLLKEIAELEEAVEAVDLAYEGLKELDDYYRLVNLKLDTALLLLHHPDTADLEERTSTARTQATDALVLADTLQTSNISLDQKDELTESGEMHEIREKLQRLVLFGGSGLFNTEETRQAKFRRVGAALRKALFKYTAGQHQTTEGPQVKRRDHLADFEIPEGEEEINVADHVILPLSQAVVLIEEEVLPAVEAELENNPGDPELIKRRDKLRLQVEDFKTSKFFPRARPATLERDLFTASLAGYTPSGEVLVKVDLPAIQSSGNTYDHLLAHLKVQIIRDCAGSGLSEKLDSAVKSTRSLESGKRGSMLDTLSKLDVPGLFRDFSVDYPFLRRLENREDLKLLADLASRNRRDDLRKIVSAMAAEDTNLLEATTKRLKLPGESEEPLEE